jgi:hypothetical protein
MWPPRLVCLSKGTPQILHRKPACGSLTSRRTPVTRFSPTLGFYRSFVETLAVDGLGLDFKLREIANNSFVLESLEEDSSEEDSDWE